ncbi:MAG: DUF4833 domain-containing protein [Spirochaetes bacterium]|nr:DUF4833 domain-containing protein [Spirochaetota bacterium]
MKMKSYKTGVLLFFFLLPVYIYSLPMFPAEFSAEWVFSISNTLGASKVVYGVNVNRSGNFQSSSPVYNYWYRPSGNNPRKVTYFENEKMYGIKQQRVAGSEVEIILKAYDDMPIKIRPSGNKVKAYVSFNGKEYQLKSVYVNAESAMIGLKVKSVYLILDENGKEIKKKIR